jgi:hypothetical protein
MLGFNVLVVFSIVFERYAWSLFNVSLYGDTKRAKASTYIYMIHDNPIQNNVPIRLA